MTDNEILRAIKTCIKGNCYSENCLYFNRTDEARGCVSNMLHDILNLINRQKAEIAELRKENERLYFECEFQSEESIISSKDKETMRCVIDDLSNQVKTAKAEAIKEFAERLKDKIIIKKDLMYYHPIIDNLVKEMVGDE